MNKRQSIHSEEGFALLEVIVVLVIMALVGLMAWRGMDAMIRGRETIERKSNQDASYAQLIRQFERDCQEIIKVDELNMAMTNSASANNIPGANVSTNTNAAANALNNLVAGSKNIWWMRRFRTDKQDAWLLVGYGMGPNGLQRWTSQPLLRRTEASSLWTGISRDPDLNSSDLIVSLEMPAIVRQVFQVQTSGVGGVGSVAGTNASTPATSAITTTSTPDGNPTRSNNAVPSNVFSGQQGVIMQWWIRGDSLPITRSCLMSSAI